MREEPPREEPGQEGKSVHITAHKQRKARKVVTSFLLSTGQDVANKIPAQLPNFSS